ncbi:cytochrome P450 [Mycobacteroides abscessus subsp. abscessus]|uniref:cytochrome P450 family protein n=1 Tax=Mycobacteroides abscessus TaxID=36809 RepID=UPI00092A6CA7|nr:cytochrome P450 [Mycobacteroides abscessus]SIM26399.1 cytochrome P450 [Mycobacteroides abscessus subsp. abscessus]SLC78599.1 cytochrome P450 [Mycobacteroides abscessus subsp. abscessus]
MAQHEALTVLDDEFFDNPWPTYSRLREVGPIHRIRLPNGLRAWLVIDYQLGKQVLSDQRLSKDEASSSHAARSQGIDTGWQDTAGPRPLRMNLLNTDPPEHTRLRALVNKAFTPAASARIRPAIEDVARELVQPLVDGPATADLLARYATPLPITVICRLLGVPEKDQNTFGSLIVTIMDETAVADGEPSRLARVQLGEYLGKLIAERRALRNGTETDDNDLLDRLITAQVDQDRLSDMELISTIGLLLVAGYDTTVHLIANSIFRLATDPALLDRVHSDSDSIGPFIDEMLRWEGPGHTATLRHTTSPITLGDKEIGAGEFLIVSVAAANRDPAAYTDPQEFHLGRKGPGHLSFGHGIHYCVGAPLARLEAEIAVATLVANFPNLRLAVSPDTLRWRRSMIIRGRTELPVQLF